MCVVGWCLDSCFLCERFCLVGVFPFPSFASEVSVGGGVAVLGFSEVELFEDGGGAAVEVVCDDVGEFFVADFSGAESVDVDGYGFGYADGVGELYFTSGGEFGGYDVFGDVASHVGCGAVDF